MAQQLDLTPQRAADDDRDHLRHEVEHAGHALAGQGPISTFIHHNTLHGFEHLSFEEATIEAERVLGGRCYLPPEANRAHHASGRITDADLSRAIAARAELSPDALLAVAGDRQLRAGELHHAHMVHGVARTDPDRLRFDARELGVLERLRHDVAPAARTRILERAGRDEHAALTRVGSEVTLAGWLGERTGLDVVGVLRRRVESAGPAGRAAAHQERSFKRLGIPPEQRARYLRCVDDVLAGALAEPGADRDALRAAWLREEARVVDKLARRHFGVRGSLPALEARIDTRREAVAVGGLWRAALDLWGLDDPLSPTDAGHLSGQRDADGGAAEAEWQRLAGLRRGGGSPVPPAEAEWALDDLARLGRDRTHADLLRDLAGLELARDVDERMIRLCAAFLDEGQSAWRMPDRTLGFYAAWRQMARADRTDDLLGIDGWRHELDHLPETAEDAVIAFLAELGVQRDDWGPYLQRLILALPGWAGLIAWREARPEYPRQQAQPIDLVQYLAARLFYEKLLVQQACARLWGASADAGALRHLLVARPHEVLVRRELFGGRLPEALAAEARGVVDELAGAGDDASWRPMADRLRLHREGATGPDAHGDAWRLFQLAQLLGLAPAELAALTDEERDRVMGALDAFPEAAHGPVWLAAFERHYRDEILNAVAGNHGRGRWITRAERPTAQTVFCIDEREEAFRRHLEEIDPGYETFGTAGFFGVAMNYEALDDHEWTPVCPVPSMAQNYVVEHVRPGDEDPRHQQEELVGWADVFHNSYWEAKRNSVSAYFLYDLIAAFVAVPLFGRIFAPRRYTRAADQVKHRITPAVRTRLTLNAEQEGHGLGFTLEQQADKIEGTLRNIGLVSGFAPLVLFSGHGSQSANNPHESAHDCGACGGKHGGPNARAFSAMANRPEVRAILRERGIDIPDDTHFIGSQHNTCSEAMTYLDVEDVPETHRARFEQLVADFDEARARSAQERCRRFGSAPRDPTPAEALAHVEARSVDLSQVRPEWGHATNACAFFGRRSMTQGLFLDRRGFLVSYDPTIDPDGTIIERILLSAGPVGAGISLEYYFSTVDNETFGCDTKLPHNVAGLVGVMEGTTSDLRTGLPLQMVEVHEAMRLLVVVDATPETLGMIYGRQPAIQTLVGLEWIHLVSVHPDTGDIQVFVPGTGFVAWDGEIEALPEVGASLDWYRGSTEFLPPARIATSGVGARG